jgi:SAM-dependent methyltransferase/RimJ/RimL family protein N-acetyltransferase
VVSALVGVVGREAVHMAIPAHSPFYGRHSPGVFHLMLAGLEMANAGIPYFDLTPGGAWKERFANAHDEVFELRIHGRRSARALGMGLAHARSAAKRLIQMAGVDPTAVVELTAPRRGRIARSAARLVQWVRLDRELRLYTMVPSAAPPPDAAVAIRKNCVEDLLKFEPVESGQSRQAFLADALKRLEDGDHVFTISDGERLLHYGWLVEGQQKACLTEVGQTFTFTEPTPVLYGFYTHPAARGRGYYRSNLCHILGELAVSKGARRAFICVLADNAPSRRVIEKVGFKYLGSLWHQRRLGRDMRWATEAFTADGLPPERIVALKETERRNRDLGATEYLQQLLAERGPYNLWAEARTLLHHISPHPEEATLDAGAGVGRLALLVAPKVSRLVCVDLSTASLDVIKSQAEIQGVRNIEIVPADLCSIPASLGPFDNAYSVEVIQHIPSDRERRAALARIYESLKPGGRCLISVVCWSSQNRRGGAEKEGFWGTGDRRLYAYSFTPHEIGRLLIETGFRDIRLRCLRVLPGRITRRLPTSLARVETWCSMVPVFSGMGDFVIAMGRRP